MSHRSYLATYLVLVSIAQTPGLASTRVVDRDHG